jgi:DNA-binding CsgD family transcriptional regulator
LRVLDAYVDIVLSVNDARAARTAADELSRIAAGLHSPLVDAMSTRAMGAVLLAEQDTRGALVQLRQALTAWREIEAPYEAARVRVLIALACRNQGDCDTAELELTSARGVFEQLGATPDFARVEALLREPPAHRVEEGLLTAREVEVLVLIASGRTNRAIAGELGISEKTVARHVSNIFVKLDLPSRAAATAYAYQRGLV